MASRQWPLLPSNGASVKNVALSGGATGIVQSYAVPAGKNSMIRWVSVANVAGGTPTIAVQVRLAGTTVQIFSAAVAFTMAPNIHLDTSDQLQINVTVAAVGSTFDLLISVEEYSI